MLIPINELLKFGNVLTVGGEIETQSFQHGVNQRSPRAIFRIEFERTSQQRDGLRHLAGIQL